MWIKEIRLKNYRAFGEEVVVSISGKRHLLIYGENGSGKSSLCNAVREVLKNPLADDIDDSYTANIWYDKKQGEETGEIKLVFDDDMQVTWKRSGEFVYDGKANSEEEENDDRVSRIRSAVLRLGKFSGFLSYKDLIPIYGPTLLSPEAEGERMFNLFTKVLFAHYQIKDVAAEGGIRTREFSDIYQDIQQRLLDGEPYENVDLRAIIEESISDTNREDLNEEEVLSDAEKEEAIYESEEELEELIDREIEDTDRDDIFMKVDVKGQLATLNAEVEEARKKIVEEANRYLTTYFKSKVVFDISTINTRVVLTDDGEKIKFVDPFVTFGVGLYRTQIPDYRNTLNEARLSSFSLCFMLAAIKQLPVAPGDPRVLFLDDIFTGLDLSNRKPLLELIKTEFIDDPVDKAPFQVAIATHDRSWYEFAERWFKAEKVSVKTIEMYAQRMPGDREPDQSVIIDRSSTYEDQARAHFSIGDYPATALNLRKAIEQQLKRFVPVNKQVMWDETTGLIKKKQQLASLLSMAKSRLTDASPTLAPPFETAIRISARLLNPFAHDDNGAPFFRREMDDGFELLEEFKSIELNTLIPAVAADDEPLTYADGGKSQQFYVIDSLVQVTVNSKIIGNLASRYRLPESKKAVKDLPTIVKYICEAVLKTEYSQEKIEQVVLNDGSALVPKTTPPENLPPASEGPGS